MIAHPDIVESAYGQVLGSTWTGVYTGEGESEPANRMKRFKEWLRMQDIDTVAVVSHGTFLKNLLGLKKGPGNCEVIEAYFDTDGELRTDTWLTRGAAPAAARNAEEDRAAALRDAAMIQANSQESIAAASAEQDRIVRKMIDEFNKRKEEAKKKNATEATAYKPGPMESVD